MTTTREGGSFPDEVPAAPPCTPWCHGHQSVDRNGWDIINDSDNTPTKRCARAFVPVVDPEVEVTLERFADMDWDAMTVEVCTPVVRIGGTDLTSDQARALTRQLIEAATLIESSVCS